jgi:hypothetical protein
VAVEYFTKWVEAEALASITSQVVEKFIWKNIICRFGLPHDIIFDNGTQFASRQIVSFLSGLGIRNNFTSISHPASNGLAEVTNRTIMNGLRKKVQENQKDWPNMLEEILWAYRTTPREATQQSPYSLVYGMEAVTPLKLITPSFRIDSYDEANNREARAIDLELLPEIRERAQVRIMEYQRWFKKAFEKTIASTHFQHGDLVLRKVESIGKKVEKLDVAWEGPFRIVRSYNNGSYKLETTGRKEIPRSWNARHLRKFYL